MKSLKKTLLATLLLALCVVGIHLTAMADANLGDITAAGIKTIDGTTEGASYIYYTFTVKKPGYLDVTGIRKSSTGYALSLYPVLCNASRSPIDQRLYQGVNAENEELKTYGLVPGTYVMRVEGGGKYTYRMVMRFTETKDQGKSKKKALTLKKNRARWDVISAGGKANESGWFKFKANGKKKVILEIDCYGQGYFNVQVRGKNKLTCSATGNKTTSYILYSKRGTKELPFRAGTYYIKITKSVEKSNGAISLKWYYK